MIFSTTTALLSLALAGHAAPASRHVSNDRVTTVSLHQRSSHSMANRTTAWVKNQGAGLRQKYNVGGALDRRQTSGSTSEDLVNLNGDSSYVGSIMVGTPPTPYYVILDTGSSDLWLADSSCARCGGVPSFDESQSSTYTNLNSTFSISYGSGAASGFLGMDVVQMADFEVPNQVFALVDRVSTGLLDDGVSGLLGLGWNTIASSGATPLVQTLFEQGALQEPMFGFFLTRFLDVLQEGDSVAQFGGQVTLGGADSQLYTGDIEFINIPTGQEGFWMLELTTLLVDGNEITIPASENLAAIDTGTTLFGGPSDMIAAIYAQVPGAAAGTGDLEGYYTYPCSSEFKVQVGFGSSGSLWQLDARDILLMQVSSTECIGALFAIDLSGGAGSPSFILGGTFLKSVYSVYRFNPPSVGFAQLSSFAQSKNGVVGAAIPSPTTAADPIVATASGISNPGATNTNGNELGSSRNGGSGQSNAAAGRFGSSAWAMAIALCGVVVFGL